VVDEYYETIQANVRLPTMMGSSSLNSENSLKKQMLENNRVIVRVWTSEINPTVPGEAVGHASIETSDLYLSLWPADLNKTEGKGFTKPIAADAKENYLADLSLEKRPAELTFCFYTLDKHSINTAYQALIEKKLEWSVTGLRIFGGGDSCVSSVWKLLKAGGIQDLISNAEQSMLSSQESRSGSSLFGKPNTRASSYSTEMMISPLVKSPDYLGMVLQQAKLNELKKNPLTTEIIFSEETIIAEAEEKKSEKCNIL